MSVNSTLKKEGIKIIRSLDGQEINTIAKSISSKLCLAFPEHNLVRSDLFASLSTLDMYVAEMDETLSGAKYFYKNNSIYFNSNLKVEDMPDIAVHEALHFIQEQRDVAGNVIKMGLYDFASGLALNEAAVQLMTAEANMSVQTTEKYFNISLNTISPDCYPLECCILNQMAYFTGYYPLYHSTINSDDIFKNTFISKSTAQTYYTILKNLDSLLKLENDINNYSLELQFTESVSYTKKLNKVISKKKDAIIKTFFNTQNIIMKSCFSHEFNAINDIKALNNFQSFLYEFKDVIAYTEGYTFYNDFYIEMMSSLQHKSEYLEKYGKINTFKPLSKNLVVVDSTAISPSIFKLLSLKLLKLFKLNKSISNNINDI